jgi:hypothetical protein
MPTLVQMKRAMMLTLMATAMLFAGCAAKPVVDEQGQKPPVKSPPPLTGGGVASPSSPQPAGSTSISQPGTLALAEGVDLYNQGQFQAAIRKLQDTPEIWTNPVPAQVEAYKYLAFSQCVTRQTTQCRQSFERLLNLAPSFELSRAEAGHPTWGPVFKMAQNAARKPTSSPVRP